MPPSSNWETEAAGAATATKAKGFATADVAKATGIAEAEANKARGSRRGRCLSKRKAKATASAMESQGGIVQTIQRGGGSLK